MDTTIRTDARLGERTPDWQLPQLDGGLIGPAQFRGTPALLFFWGSW